MTSSEITMVLRLRNTVRYASEAEREHVETFDVMLQGGKREAARSVTTRGS